MEFDITNLGPRVAILGNMCSGKSTLAAKLGKQLDLPAYHLDRIRWMPGGNDIKRHRLLYWANLWVAEERWIIDGSYASALPIILLRATSIIYLQPSRWIAFWRYLQRLYGRNQIGVNDGDKPKFYWSTIKYILWDVPRYNQPELMALLRDDPRVTVVK